MYSTMIFIMSLAIIFEGVIVGYVADNKGRPFFTWFLIGLPFGIIALIYLLLSSPSDDNGKYRKCPYCAEIVKKEAKICHYCGKELSSVSSSECNKEVDDVTVNKRGDIDNDIKTLLKTVGAIIIAIIIVGIATK